MSSREHLLDRAATWIADGMDDGLHADEIARTVLDATLPLITDPKQLLGVPEASILIGEEHHEGFVYQTLYQLRGKDLIVQHDGTRGEIRHDPAKLLTHGSLTVVWMP